MASQFSQAFPRKPKFTEANLPELVGKVILITGGSSGLGLELSKLLYAKNATVYLAARSQPNAETAIKDIRAHAPDSRGRVVFLHLDLADLASVKSAAHEFLAKESQLHILYHNAGLLLPPKDSFTKQGYELQLGVHCIGPMLLTLLLKDTLRSTAKTPGTQAGDVRVIWLASMGRTLSPTGGVDIENVDYSNKVKGKKEPGSIDKYNISKAGVYFLAGEFGRRSWPHGVVNISLDPGNLKTNLQRNFSQEMGKVANFVLGLMLHPANKGAYTMLYAGFSPEVTLEKAKDPANWVMPFGRIVRMNRNDLVEAFQPEGAGKAFQFWEWCAKQVQPYL